MRFWSRFWITAGACGLMGAIALNITSTTSEPTIDSVSVTTPGKSEAMTLNTKGQSQTNRSKKDPSQTRPAVSTTKSITVMAIGGSVAEGWTAKAGRGYLTVAMNGVSKQLNQKINFENKSVEGYTPAKFNGQFPGLLKSVKPQVVIISWGLLDDISAKTSESQFTSGVEREISLATKAGADVWIVTPPVTRATYVGADKILEPKYALDEILAGRAIKSGHIYAFDLMDDMKRYLVDHKQTYLPYMKDGWHPNTAGHVLAGQLLADAIVQRAHSLGLK